MSKSDRIDQFTAAALQIVARDGLSALSFRAVAAETGWSLGAVQKAFPNKQDLIRQTLLRAQAGAGEAVGPPASPDLATWLRNLLLQTLPLDPQRRAAVVISVAFSDRAPFDPTIAAAIAENTAAIREQLVRVLAWRRSEGEISPRLGDDSIARLLLAFSTGMATELLCQSMAEDAAEALVTDAIDALLAG